MENAKPFAASTMVVGPVVLVGLGVPTVLAAPPVAAALEPSLVVAGLHAASARSAATGTKYLNSPNME